MWVCVLFGSCHIGRENRELSEDSNAIGNSDSYRCHDELLACRPRKREEKRREKIKKGKRNKMPKGNDPISSSS